MTPAFGRGVILLARERAASTPWPTCAAAANTARTGTAPGMLDTQAERVRRFHRRGANTWSSEGHTARDRLAIRGGSNGGLLVGAALTQRPELFRAVVCQVPLARHGALPPFRIARALDPGVRLRRRPEAFRVALRLLALPPRQRRHGLSGRPPHHRRVGQPRRPAPRPQDGGAAPGGDLVRPSDPPARRDARRPRPGKPLSKALEEWTTCGRSCSPSSASTPDRPRTDPRGTPMH